MARTKIRTNGWYAAYADCPKVMLQAHLEKQKWFIAALGTAVCNRDKANWESRCASTMKPGTFNGRDPEELTVKMKSGTATVEIVVKMNDDQGFEIRMAYGQEQRRGDGSLVIWYSNNIEGAAERVKRHYETHGVPWAVKEVERNAKRVAQEEEKKQSKIELETAIGTTFGQEKWSNNMYFEQGSFGIAFRHETIGTYDDLPKEAVGTKVIKLQNVVGYFTKEEFRDFLEYMGTRPRLVAERLRGQVSNLNPKSS